MPAYEIVIEFCEVPDNQKLLIIGCVAALYATKEAAHPLANVFGRLIVTTVALAAGPVPVVKNKLTAFCPPANKSVTGPVPAPVPYDAVGALLLFWNACPVQTPLS